VSDSVERGFRLDTGTPGTLGVHGVLDFGTAAAALLAIRSASHGMDRLDLSGVTRSDSAGLACVLAVMAEAGRNRAAVQVTGMPEGMQALARVCEVDQLIS